MIVIVIVSAAVRVIVSAAVRVIVSGAVPVIVMLLVPHASRMTGKAHCSTSTPAIRTRLQMPRTMAGAALGLMEYRA